MQTYRLVVGPDKRVEIPDAEPGQVVTVVLDESLYPSGVAKQFKPVSEMTDEEKAALKAEFLEWGRRIREELKDQLPIDHGDYLYGEDGLPR